MALTQPHFRFGVNELAEATHNWLGAEGFPVVLQPGRTATSNGVSAPTTDITGAIRGSPRAGCYA